MKDERESLVPVLECLSALAVGTVAALGIIVIVAYAKEIDQFFSALIGSTLR